MSENIFEKVFRKAGFQLSRINTLERQIDKGEFRWLQEMNIQTVLDVGANTGQFVALISKILPDAKIYSFEPLKECYEILKKMENSNHNLKTFNIALGNKSGEETIFKNEFTPSSSILMLKELHKSTFPHTEHFSEEIIQVKDLDSIKDKIQWVHKTLMKIDVQGFEINVLRGADASLDDIYIIIIETLFVDLYENQTQFDDVYSFLTERNFSYKGNLEQFKDPKSGRILWADAIFMRNQ